ncbi:hypothetical protein [Sphaerisporangium corydalis]|uniref:Uncharacterized protein n=1 Tax=Sphaerisporangium corydalis TaxID=1441875 RepID=A0ABV9ESJ6_9ACTN|nr:hypothetical protein [Sphaerisporangium corydalis]
MRVRLDGTCTEISCALYRLRGAFTVTAVSRLRHDRDQPTRYRLYAYLNPWDLIP